MPTRTVSAAGGNFNATGTWVGGVVPLTGDDIVADATSGPLTIPASYLTPVLVGANFTGYTNTLTITTTGDFRSSGTHTLSSSMTITGGGNYELWNTANITSNGVVIPVVQTQNGGTKTFNDNLNCGSFGLYVGNATNTLNGNSVICTTLQMGRGGGTFGVILGTTVLRVQGSTGALTFNSPSQASFRVIAPIVVNVSGTVTITGGIPIGPAGSLTWTAGTLAGDKRIFLGPGGSTPNATLDVDNAGTWDNLIINQPTAANATITLNSNISVTSTQIVHASSGAAGAKYFIQFAGTGVVNGGTLVADPSWIQILAGPGTFPANLRDWGFYLRFTGGQTYTFSSMSIYGVDYAHALIDSSGAPANLNITGPVQDQNFLFCDFTGITATGNTIYSYKGTLNTTSNIQVANNYVPTSSHTFLA
jgi:hypothetical protein